MINPDIRKRAEQYAKSNDIILLEELGYGTDGAVWKSNRNTAVKALEREIGYFNERDAYRRLAEYGLTQQIDEFWVPRLVKCSDELWVIEMDFITRPPYIIDFAKVRIDRPPDFSEETMRVTEETGRENFGGNWSSVCRLLGGLESIGIYYLDPQPDNIKFPSND
jgi:hypothetical protein